MAYVNPLDEIQKIAQKVARKSSGFVAQRVAPVVRNKVNNAVVQVGQSPFGKGLVATQRFIESPRPLTAPTINPYNTRTPLGKAGNFAANAGFQIASAPFLTAANWGLDYGKAVAQKYTGRPVAGYNQLKTAPGRLLSNLHGNNATSQQIIGNVAGTGADLLSMYFPTGAKTIVGQSVKTLQRKFIPTVVNAAAKGGRFGGAYGGLQGLSDARNQSFTDQFKHAGSNAAMGVVGGSLLGGAFGAGGYIGGSIAKALTKVFPNKSKSQLDALERVLLRDEIGRFSKTGTMQQRPQYYERMENGVKAGVSDADVQKARMALGLPPRDVRTQKAEFSVKIPKPKLPKELEGLETVYRGEGGSKPLRRGVLGTPKDQSPEFGGGKYVTPDANYAGKYGKVSAYKVNPKAKILTIGRKVNEDRTDAYYDAKTGRYYNQILGAIDDEGKAIANFAKKQGYDGIRVVDDLDQAGNGAHVETVVFNEKNLIPYNQAKGVSSKDLQAPSQGRPLSQVGSQTPVAGRALASSSNKSIAQVDNPTQPYFNVNRINVKPEVKQAIKQSVEESKPQIEAITGKKLSNKEVINFANNSAKVMRKAVNRQQTLEWEAALLRTRQLLADQAEKGTLTPEYIDNLLTVKSLGSDIARKLQSMSIGADPKEITAKQAILESILKQTKNADDILIKAKGVDFNDINQATDFYRQFVKPNAEDWLTLVRYNSMLTSPNTHIINTASNFQGTGILAPIEKTVLGGVDFLRAKATGTERRYLAGEGKEFAKGYYGALRDASFRFADVMKGKVLSGNPDVRNLPLTKAGTKARLVERTLDVPLRLLEATDQFFQTLTTKGVERSLAYRASKGVKAPNAQATAIKEAQKRLFRQDTGEKGQGIVLGAMDEVTNAIMSFRNSKNVVVRNLARFTLPFVKTPMNIIKQGVEYSPLGVTNLIGNTAKQEAITKIIIGSSIGLGTAILTSSDRLSWGEPIDQDKKNEYRAAGIQPYSVRIGDTWVSYSKLHPALAMNMALVAAVRDSLDNGKIEDSQAEKILQGLSNWWQFYADQSYLKSVGDMISSGRGDVEGKGRILANYAQQLVPFRALLGWVTRIIDPYQRKSDPDAGFVTQQLQQFMTQIPGLSQQVPARVNSLGNPIETQHRFLNALSPSRISTQNPQKAEEYKQIQEIQKINKKADYDRKQARERALPVYEKLKTLSPEVANQIAKDIKKNDPLAFTELKKEVENNKYGLNYKERSIRNLGVEDGTRAKYIANEFKKLKTKEEKNALYKEWKKKKIITDRVLQQLKIMKKRGEL